MLGNAVHHRSVTTRMCLPVDLDLTISSRPRAVLIRWPPADRPS
jgi:hypothetical protein